MAKTEFVRGIGLGAGLAVGFIGVVILTGIVAPHMIPRHACSGQRVY